MSLATRCSSCHTVFRVVQDQLKVSQGWVRCGHCQDVFNALEGLFELAEEALPVAVPGSTASAQASANPMAPAPAPVSAATSLPEPSVSGPASEFGNPAAMPSHDFVVSSQVLALDTDALAAGIDPPAHPATPDFVRRAERQARWQRPGVRGTLLAAVLVLSSLLAAQLGLQWRARLAADWPATRPALEAACTFVGCRLESPMALEQVVLDTSHLAQAGRPGELKLQAELHNSATHAIRAPALEVSFTSDSGELLARKVLLPSDLGRPGGQLEADENWRIEARLAVGTLPITGYGIEVFYP